ncbi:MAG: hypothetical protein AAFY60_03870 [Myxococcota bacterium]
MPLTPIPALVPKFPGALGTVDQLAEGQAYRAGFSTTGTAKLVGGEFAAQAVDAWARGALFLAMTNPMSYTVPGFMSTYRGFSNGSEEAMRAGAKAAV